MYEIILYDTEDERCPVQELLDGLGMQLKLEFVPMPTKNKM